jgi:hypothetical protein
MRAIIVSLISFIMAFLLFATAVYAWFTISSESKIQNVDLNLIKRDVDLSIEYGRNGGSYESFELPADLNAYLQSSLPGDLISIRVTVQNFNPESSPDLLIEMELLNILSSATDIEYDLTDFFYIVDGMIELTWYDSSENYQFENSYLVQNIFLNRIDENEIIYQGLALESYRFSNLFNQVLINDELITENNIRILEQTPMASGNIVEIIFTIGFDAYTPNQDGFQDGELSVDGLYSFLD